MSITLYQVIHLVARMSTDVVLSRLAPVHQRYLPVGRVTIVYASGRNFLEQLRFPCKEVSMQHLKWHIQSLCKPGPNASANVETEGF